MDRINFTAQLQKKTKTGAGAQCWLIFGSEIFIFNFTVTLRNMKKYFMTA
jgi:hypothetical protein